MLNIYALNKTKTDKKLKKILVYKQVLKFVIKIKTASEKSQTILFMYTRIYSGILI